MDSNIRATALHSRVFDEAKLRARRWRFFQLVFVVTYLGIILDIVTTALGVSIAGSTSAYEQNPLGGQLINSLGWAGMMGAMTAFMLILYTALHGVRTRVKPGWIRFFNWLLLAVGAMRWFAVVTALLYIVHA